MRIKDRDKNQITVFQARNGAIMLCFASVSITLSKIQVESLIGSNVYDIEEFDKKTYLKFYGE
jgi:hypothetical protein